MVTSGVPQGSVLGPVLFLAYINDITTGVRSSMRLFADDSKVYRIIYDENDEKQLQCDLNTLQKWSENWQLRFHPDKKKCEVLRVTHAGDHTSYPYKLSRCTLQCVTETVDLGVSLTSNLSWNGDPKKVVNQANKIVGFLKRNVGPGNRKSFLVCTRPWLYPFWNMLSLSGHPIYRRTLTLLNESNVGPRNTLSRYHLGTLQAKKD